MKKFISIVTTQEQMPEILDLMQGLDIQVGTTQSGANLIDAADSPIGPDEVKTLLSLVSIAITTTSAGITLIERIRALLAKKSLTSEATSSKHQNPPVQIADAKLGKIIVSINADTNILEATQKLGFDDSDTSV